MKIEKVGVFATSATINSHAYKKELQKYNPEMEVFEIPCPNWTNYIEQGLMESTDCRGDVADKMKEILLNKPDKIILGCTHYPYLLNILSDFAPKTMFIDPAEIFVKFIQQDLDKFGMLKASADFGKEEFYVSANPKDFVQNAKMFYEVKNLPMIF
jgi:glutamate racemase